MPAGKSETLTFFAVPLDWTRGKRGIDINYSKSWKCLCFLSDGLQTICPSLRLKQDGRRHAGFPGDETGSFKRICYNSRMDAGEKHIPLAERMRPRTFDRLYGQDHLLGKGKLLTQLIEADRLVSLIFWGPPGSGKTTLALMLARHFDLPYTSSARSFPESRRSRRSWPRPRATRRCTASR